MALDPNTGIEATTTELNAQVEFYDVRKHVGTADVQLPCSGNTDQGNSGAGVAVDTVHKLFLVTDPAYACDNSQDGAIVVYDEKGTVVEVIHPFKFAIAEPCASASTRMNNRSPSFFRTTARGSLPRFFQISSIPSTPQSAPAVEPASA